ncbi:F-box/LRR-repeat MAX2 homolog A [Macadamia integrifolia]|uniref:F-box/LRR-repeat MAX2 homolog A n=1 Tax=Macadamia integrifolia TaxID=60698 RepID=UPI001C52C7C7|nr:F-box/LRR-repeat MAX2 homolog A [Macadamia integrifolia]
MAGIHDLPDVILSNVFAMVEDTRSRNSMSLVSHRWRILERQTRTSLTLRGNVREPILIPDCFWAVTNLDLSLISPWGHSLFDSSLFPELLAQKLSLSFPSVTSLTVYARTHHTLRILAPRWPNLRHVKLVRWHQRSQSPHGTDFFPLFDACPSLSSLDLSHFYCWIEDIPAALQAYPSVASSLTRLNLLILSFTEGFKSQELLTISNACPNLTHFLAPCVFHPRYNDFVGDEALLTLATNCPLLNVLHLADHSTLANTRANPDADGFTQEDARISRLALEDLVSCLPRIQELTLDVCFNVRDAGPALELLGSKCPRLISLKVGQFHGICKAIESQLDGIALCGNGLEALSIKNSADLTDASLIAISRGCPRLSKFELQGCKNITETGMKRFVGMLRQTLVDVKISCCKQLDAASSLRALEPIRDRIQRLHIDCVWDSSLQQCSGLGTSSVPTPNELEFDLNELGDEEPITSNLPASFVSFLPLAEECASSSSSCISNIEETSNKKKKCRYSTDADCYGFLTNGNGFWCKSWEKLRYLSLWIEVGELLEPLATAGLESCPVLEEIRIRVEGDCRMKSKPAPAFGLIALARYPELVKMQLDCGDAIGYALTAPSGQMDLSLWERFYLQGIGSLNLNELDYWPPQDRDVNQRGLSLPAVGLLAQCVTLRKLFIHGTTHEHFMGFLVNMPNLRDVQLREDYYPAPENDTSTEMRVDSCSRFEAAMSRRFVPD